MKPARLHPVPSPAQHGDPEISRLIAELEMSLAREAEAVRNRGDAQLAVLKARAESTVLVSLPEAGRLLDCDPKTVRALIADGDLREVMVRPRCARVRLAEVEALIVRKTR
jgi:hypothetical protein